MCVLRSIALPPVSAPAVQLPCSAGSRSPTARLPLALFAIVIAPMAPRLFAQSFPDPGSMKDFSDAMVETPNTAMVIQPGPPNSGAGGNGPPEDPQTPSQSDDHNPIGVSGAFEGLITTGC